MTDVFQGDGTAGDAREMGEALDTAPVGSQESDEAWIRESLDVLALALHCDGGDFQETIDRVFAKDLAGPIDVATVGKVYDAVTAVLGSDATSRFLTILLRAVDDSSFLLQLRGGTHGPLVDWLIAMTGLHGEALKQANLLDGRDPDGWKDMYRRLYYEVITGRWYMQLELVKNDGTRLLVHDDPASLLLVADAIVDTLTRLPADAAHETLDNYVERFRASIEALNQLLSHEAEESPVEALGGTLPV